MDNVIETQKPVFMFSGQGSQKPGMGIDLLAIDGVAEAFACASDAFGFDIADLIAQGSPEELERTRNAQAALTALSIGLSHALASRGVLPSAVLGFSLGQISALYAAGMLDMSTTFALAAKRAELMEQASVEHPGAMCALLGADIEAATELCATCAEGEVLVIANFNCPGQIVISGTKDAIGRAQEAWASQKKRSVLLATAGAFHSPLMQEAADAFATYLKALEFSEANVPLICNVDAQSLEAENARKHLVRHLVEPVRFEQSVVALTGVGASEFIEIGFGGVLVGLVKRIDKSLARRLIADVASFEELALRSEGAR